MGYQDAEHSPERGDAAPTLDSLEDILALADGNFNRQGGGQGRRVQPAWVRGQTLRVYVSPRERGFHNVCTRKFRVPLYPLSVSLIFHVPVAPTAVVSLKLGTRALS